MDLGKRRWLAIGAAAVVLGAILSAGAYYRLHRITEEGMHEGDTVEYYRVAKRWSSGHPDEFMGDTFYRPVVYAANATALRVFGDNDYSIKLMNSLFDLASIALIVFAGWQLSGSVIPGIGAAGVYALMPYAIRQCRIGMPHTLSVLLVLAAVCLFRPRWLAEGRLRARLAFDGLAGFCLGLAANTHAELGFLGFGFVACQALSTIDRGRFGRMIGRFVSRAGALTLGFASTYLAGMLVFGYDKVVTVLSNEIGRSAGTPVWVKPAPLYRAPYDALAITSESAFGHAIWLPVLALLPVAAFAIQRARRGGFAPAAGYTLTILLSAYLVVFPLTVGSFDPQHARIFLPMIPIVLLGGMTGLYFMGDALIRRWRAAPVVVAALCIVTLTPRAMGAGGYFDDDRWYRQEIARAAHDAIGDRVDSDHKLLIVPSSAYYTSAFELEFYFGRNAAFLADVPRQEPLSPELLYRVMRDGGYSYVLRHPRIDLRFMDPTMPTALRDKPWHAGEPYHYDAEQTTIDTFLSRCFAHRVGTVGGAPILTLRKEPLFPNSDFASGDLRSWDVAGPVEMFALRDSGDLPVPSAFRLDTRPRADDGAGGDYARTGELVSPSFVIAHDTIGFVIGGRSNAQQTHVALRVGGTELRAAPAGDGLQVGDWDVSQYRGQDAQVIVRDLDPALRRGIVVGGFYYVY